MFCFKDERADAISPCVCWCHVYDITRRPVYNVLHGMLVPADKVDDYFEDAIERMMRNENRKHVLCVCSDPQVKKYACSVARFIVLEERKSHAKRQRLEQENPEAMEPLTGQDKPDIFHVFVTELENEIANGLSERERAVITMSYKEGRTPGEMAVALGLSKTTVYNILKQTKQKLKG